MASTRQSDHGLAVTVANQPAREISLKAGHRRVIAIYADSDAISEDEFHSLSKVVDNDTLVIWLPKDARLEVIDLDSSEGQPLMMRDDADWRF